MYKTNKIEIDSENVKFVNLPNTNRKFLPSDFRLLKRKDIQSYFRKLLDQRIDNLNDFELFLFLIDELNIFLSEEDSIRRIKYFCDINNEQIKK